MDEGLIAIDQLSNIIVSRKMLEQAQKGALPAYMLLLHKSYVANTDLDNERRPTKLIGDYSKETVHFDDTLPNHSIPGVGEFYRLGNPLYSVLDIREGIDCGYECMRRSPESVVAYLKFSRISKLLLYHSSSNFLFDHNPGTPFVELSAVYSSDVQKIEELGVQTQRIPKELIRWEEEY
jgi:hypothetical protein